MAGVAVIRDAHAAGRRVLPAVEGEASHPEHRLGNCVQPPVDQVEVVSGLVHEQAARLLLLPVPAAKVVRAVTRVEQVVHVHLDHLADHALLEQPSHQRAAGPPPVVEGHRERAASAPHRVHDCTAPGRVNRHGLLGYHVAAQLHRPHDVPVVEGVHRGHDDGVGMSLPHHRVEVPRVEDGDRPATQLLDDVAAVVVEPGKVRIA